MTTAQQARLNLPLPPELREMVYDYCVAIKHDCLDEDWSRAPCRKLHTSITRINKTTRDEVLAYLYRTHTFVRFDYILPNFEEMIIAYNMPFIIQPASSSTLDTQVLSIEAKMQNAVMTNFYSTAEDDRLNTGTAFLLTQDLPALFDLLRMAALQTRMYFNCIDTPRGSQIAPHLMGYEGYVLRLHITVQKSARSTFEGSSQANLLRHLCTVRGGVRVSFHGFDTAESLGMDTGEVAQCVHPSMVWLRAWDWDRLDWLMHWKERADAIASSKSTCKLYLALLALHQISELFAPFDSVNSAPSPPDPDLARVQEYHTAIKIDVALTTAQLNIACGAVTIAGQNLNGYKPVLDHLSEWGQLSRQTRQHWARIALALGLIEYIQGKWSDSELLIDLVDKAEEAYYASTQDYRLMHDIVYAKKLIARTDTEEGHETMEDMSAELEKEISIFKLPLPVINSLPPESQLGRPKGLEGWEDVLHKAELSPLERAEIEILNRIHELSENQMVGTE